MQAAPAPPGSRFLSLCADDDARKQLSRWARLEALLDAPKSSEDTCRAVAARCAPPRRGESARAVSAASDALASLAMWRASAVGSDVLPPDRASVAVALLTSSRVLAVGHSVCDLRRALGEAEEEAADLDGQVRRAVRTRNEDALSSLVVRRLTLRGLLRENEYRLEDALREEHYELKREAMLRMVQSGMLPIELKVATLGAAREEEELNDLKAEAQMVQHDPTMSLEGVVVVETSDGEVMDVEKRIAFLSPILLHQRAATLRCGAVADLRPRPCL